MEHVLLATDGSAHAQAALDVASALALRDGADVHVVHVVTDRQPREEERRAVEVEFAEELIERSRSLMHAIDEVDDTVLAKAIASRQSGIAKVINSIMGEGVLVRAEADLRGRKVGKVMTALVEGEPAERILALAEERCADAIVMGSHGHGRLEGVFMGSVSQAVAHRARCTVVTVK